MGLRGPKAKSAEEHIRRGNPGKRTVKSDPQEFKTSARTIELLVPDKPDWLADDASLIWDQLLPMLLATGTVNALDAHVLGDYCQLAAEMERLHSDLAKTGYLVRTETGKRRRPEVGLLRELRKDALKLMDVLGLTPKARKAMNITVKLPKEADDRMMRRLRILHR